MADQLRFRSLVLTCFPRCDVTQCIPVAITLPGFMKGIAMSLAPEQLFSVDDLIASAGCHAEIIHGSESRPIRVEIYEFGCSPEDQGDGPIVFQVEYRNGAATAFVWYGQRSCEISGLSTIRQTYAACADYRTLDDYMDAVMSEFAVEDVDDGREERARDREYLRSVRDVWE